jgi:hypothetical protein
MPRNGTRGDQLPAGIRAEGPVLAVKHFDLDQLERQRMESMKGAT